MIIKYYMIFSLVVFGHGNKEIRPRDKSSLFLS